MRNGATRPTASARRRASHPAPDLWDDRGLISTEEVPEQREEAHSSLLGPDGEPLPYQSKKLGYVGFIHLKERP